MSIVFPRTNDVQYTPIRFILRNTTESVIDGVKISPPEEFDAKGEMQVTQTFTTLDSAVIALLYRWIRCKRANLAS